MSRFCTDIAAAWREDYLHLAKKETDKLEKDKYVGVMRNSLQRHMAFNMEVKKEDGFSRMEKCRYALRVLDDSGWKRSFHQREFHEAYIRAVRTQTPLIWPATTHSLFQSP